MRDDLDFKETQHGRNHGPGGSDQIRAFIQSPYVQFTLDVTSGSTVVGKTSAVLAVQPNSTVGGWTVGLHLDVVAGAGDVIALGALLYSIGVREFFLTETTVIDLGSGDVEHLAGAAVLITGQGFDLVTWDTHASGAVLLNRSPVYHPSFVNAGKYSINANVAVS